MDWTLFGVMGLIPWSEIGKKRIGCEAMFVDPNLARETLKGPCACGG